jgi:hypothetical protein
MIPIIAILLITTFTVIGIGFTAYSTYKAIKPDYCEWVICEEEDGDYRYAESSCGNTPFVTIDCDFEDKINTVYMVKKDFCPYCGRKIKVVEK